MVSSSLFPPKYPKMSFNLNKRLEELNMATKNKNIYKIGKVYSSNPFSKIIEKTKGKNEIEKEQLTQVK